MVKNYCIFKSKEPQLNGICVKNVKKPTFLPLTRAERNYFQKIGRKFIFQHLRKILRPKL